MARKYRVCVGRRSGTRRTVTIEYGNQQRERERENRGVRIGRTRIIEPDS